MANAVSQKQMLYNNWEEGIIYTFQVSNLDQVHQEATASLAR